MFAHDINAIRISLLGILPVAAEAATVTSAEYFPLNDCNSWTYSVDGMSTVAMTVAPGITVVTGVATKAVEFTDGSISYFTSDPDGLAHASCA
jgi:hypothetical protein